MSYNPPSGGWPPRPQDPREGADRAPGSPWSNPAPSYPAPSPDQPSPPASSPGWGAPAQPGGYSGANAPGQPGGYSGANAAGTPSYPSSGYGTPPPPGYGAGYQPGGSGYPVYGYGAGYAAPKTDGTAIAALVLAICSFLVCFGIPAIVALALIPSSRRHIAASNGTVEGTSLLTAAKWIAIVNLALVALGIIAIVVIAIAGANNSNSNSTAGNLALLLLR